MGKKLLTILFLVIVVGGLAFLVARAWERKKKQEPVQSISKIHAEKGTPVVTSLPSRRDLTDVLRFPGTVHPQTRALVVPKIEDRIEKIMYQEGEEIKAGELAVTLDPGNLKQVLRAAESALQEAQANSDRIQALFKEGGVSRKAREGAEARLEAARAQTEAAREDLEETKIYAPVAGIVSHRFQEPGELAKWGEAILEIVDISKVEVACQVSEKYIASVKPGMQADIRLDAFPEKKLESSVTRINPVADPVSRLFAVTIILENPGSLIRPGMFASVELIKEIRSQVLALPEYALLKGSEETFVFVREGNQAVKREVTVGLFAGGMVEIIEGLSGNERVIVQGQRQLGEGMKVREKESE